MNTVSHPDSAISSWSGFVYQGKVALYHSLKLILDDVVDFELQLDSTDDFAIYQQGKLLSAHQVKAKIGSYRSNYSEALTKSAQISGDRQKGTARYFHVSVNISDSSDYKDANNEVVKFYDYGGNKYCGLGDIEALTKALLKKVYEGRKGYPASEKLAEQNYCLLSEKISSKAIDIHKQNQVGGLTENEAAYTNRISSAELLDDLLNEGLQDDVEYFAIELRKNIFEYLELLLDATLENMTDPEYLRMRGLFDHLHDLHADDLKHLCQLIKPSERFSKVQRTDIERYSVLIQEFCIEPTLERLPHYLDNDYNFYLPTALALLSERESRSCVDNIRFEMKQNEKLLPLLFEYKNLIAHTAPKSFSIESKITDNDGSDPGYEGESQDGKITRELNVAIITRDDAEAKLNA
ncbi:ABC-three component system protein [Pseudomonas sp. EA_105y_Pfl2_R69]|uniref:ABC-three component system protein n=1 Tax=Pseudomonas sp. EA_105y_Pfl2_R69 TaxID=3088683 RepID=UPI0030D9A84B